MNKLSFLKLIKSVKSFVLSHKIWSVVILLALIFLGYKLFGNKTSTETRYVISSVTKSTVIASVSGSGQVEATSTIDLKPKVSGNVVSIKAKAGTSVKKWETLFVLDSGDAGKQLRDAKLNLQIAQNDLVNAKKNYESTKASGELSLKNLLLALNSSLVAVPDNNNNSTNVVSISGSYTSTTQGRYTLEVYACQNGACVNYSGLESGSFPINTNISQPLGNRGLYATFTAIPKNLEKWYIDVPSPASNSYAANLKAYEDGKISIPEAIDSANATVLSRQLAVTQKENALSDMQDILSDYYITAPFDGKVASVVAELGGQASPSTSLGTIITDDEIASISLNEVDVAKIKLGQKVTLTFDAIDGLSVDGVVAEIDSVGTITQGVVNYNVKINFATNDDRIKPGMSTDSTISTDIAENVLTVPNSAVKTKNGKYYVEIFNTPLPKQVPGVQGSPSSTLPRQQIVETGLSNDKITEIISGLKEGDQVVSKTISGGATTTATTSAPSIFGTQGNRAGGGVRTTQAR